MWERTKKLAILKQLQLYCETKYLKSIGMPFPRVPAPLHTWLHFSSEAQSANAFVQSSFAPRPRQSHQCTLWGVLPCWEPLL